MSRALDVSLRAEQAAHPEAGFRRWIVEAGGMDPGDPCEQGRRILRWLGSRDDWATGGVVELLAAAWAAGGLPEGRVGQRQLAGVREESPAVDEVVRRYDGQRGGRR